MIIFEDLYVKKIYKVVWGLTPHIPYCDVSRGRLRLDRTKTPLEALGFADRLHVKVSEAIRLCC